MILQTNTHQNVQLLLQSADHQRQLEKQIVDALELIESFVTYLYPMNDESNKFDELFDLYYRCINRTIFPHLNELSRYATLDKLKKWFGRDLSRFIELYIDTSASDNLINLDITFGSLQRVYFTKCGDIERDILKQSLKTLKSVNFDIVNQGYNAECFDCTAPIIISLNCVISVSVVFKPVVFTNLRHLNLGAYCYQIGQFFSVTHPVLSSIDITELRDGQTDSILAPQPAIRSFHYRSSGVVLLNKLLKIVDVNAVTELFFSVSNKEIVELPCFTKLSTLTTRAKCSGINQLLKTNQIRKLYTFGNINIKPLISYLTSLTYC
jgi:hypothetical protein